ncbi:MAG: tetratricopeptide repeat protein [Planctomycetota bacterium]
MTRRRPHRHRLRLPARAVVLLPAIAAGLAWASTPASLPGELEQALLEYDQAQLSRAADQDRARQSLRSAAQRFQSVISSGVMNGRLEYNLGNCHLQLGDLGRAILHYRRAQRLNPDDGLLEANLAIARQKCLTNVRPTAGGELLRSVLFIHFQTSRPQRLAASLISYLLLWGLLALRAWRPRRWLAGAAAVCALLSLSLGASAAWDEWTDRKAPPGVVIAMDVPVYKGPGAGYPRQFEQPLQPGVEFVRREQRGDWQRIELADGNSGWIHIQQAELIPTAEGSRDVTSLR